MTRTCTSPRCWRPATVAVTTPGFYLPRTRYICTYCAGLEQPKPVPQEPPPARPVPRDFARTMQSRERRGDYSDAQTTRVLAYVVEHGPIGRGDRRAQAMRRLGLSKSQLSLVLNRMRRAGWLDKDAVTSLGVEVHRRRSGSVSRDGALLLLAVACMMAAVLMAVSAWRLG